MKIFLSKMFLLPLFSVMLAPSFIQAQTLGRLFYSPQERREIDARRGAKIIKPPLLVAIPRNKPGPNWAAITLNAPTPKPTRDTIINGFVRRTDGPNTVWVNEKPVSGNAARDEWLQPSAVNSPVRVQSSSR